MPPYHHIQRQRLELVAPGITTSTVARQHAEMAELQQRVILPALQRAFDGLATGTEEVVIERLTLELTVDGSRDLATQVAAQLPAALARALGKPIWGGSAERRTATFAAAIRRWLRTGNPGWTGRAPAEFATCLAAWTEEGTAAEIPPLLGLLLASEPAFVRARTQVRGKVLGRVVSYLQTIDASLPDTPPADRDELHRRCQLAGVLPAAAVMSTPNDGRLVQALPPEAGRVGTSAPSTEPTVVPGGTTRATGWNGGGEAVAGHFVANAGLVILHPYLKYLLERADALGPDGAPDYGKAALVLHYAVFGNTRPPEEWDLPLTKLLLGLGPDDLLLPDRGLSTAAKAATDDLLEGVIGHWSALKSTSPAGLREAFLQREGKLAPAPEGYVLTVETATLDLLLDRLPWGIGLVKSPWMAQALQVSWR